VQFGITLVAIFSGAFGGVTLASIMAKLIEPIPVVGIYSASISLTIVVMGITVASLIFGELVPKRLALTYPDTISMIFAIPLDFLSRLAAPFVDLCSRATDAALHLIGIRSHHSEPTVSDDEVRILIREGLRTGVFKKSEGDMVEGVLDLDELRVGEIMTPRTRIVWLNIDDPDEVNWRKIVASGNSHFPVYQNSRDNVLGTVSVKALWANLSLAQKAELKSLLVEPLFVPTSMSGMKLLETFKQNGVHFALVTDEFGGVDGLVSLNDVLEAVVGEMPSKDQPKKHQIKKIDDASWVVDAMVEIDEFKNTFGFNELPDEDADEYQTVGGFVINRFGRIPDEGDALEFKGFRLEVLDMDKHRIDKVLV
jgi:putative hemolysin